MILALVRGDLPVAVFICDSILYHTAEIKPRSKLFAKKTRCTLKDKVDEIILAIGDDMLLTGDERKAPAKFHDKRSDVRYDG